MSDNEDGPHEGEERPSEPAVEPSGEETNEADEDEKPDEEEKPEEEEEEKPEEEEVR